MWTQETIERQAAAYVHLVCKRNLDYIPEEKLAFFIRDAFIEGCKYIIDNTQKQ